MRWRVLEQHAGYTWMELLIMFEVTTGAQVTTEKQRQDQEVSIQQLIAVFKQHLLRTAATQPAQEGGVTP